MIEKFKSTFKIDPLIMIIIMIISIKSPPPPEKCQKSILGFFLMVAIDPRN